jgi:hypothetical protein
MIHSRMLPLLFAVAAATLLPAAQPPAASAQCTSCTWIAPTASWPSSFVAYKNTGGATIQDPSDEAPLGVDVFYGIAPDDASARVAFDGTYAFFRIMLSGTPASPTGGGNGDYDAYMWLVQIATAAGQHVATVGLDGNGKTTEESVYVVEPDGTDRVNVYTQSANPGMARVVPVGAQFYLDIQVPLCYITYAACHYNGSVAAANTPLKFYYGTSTSARVVNKDFFYGVTVDFAAMGIAIFTNISSGLLPVELTSFSVGKDDRGALLRWRTATERNSYGFEVERSYDRASWTIAGFVPAAGSSNEPRDYALIDPTQPAFWDAPVFYRLRMMDRDGGEEFSSVIECAPSAASSLRLAQNYPNPFNPATVISYTLPADQTVTLRVYDALGRMVRSFHDGDLLAAGTHTEHFSGKDLPAGSYLVRLESGGESSQRTMVLAR